MTRRFLTAEDVRRLIQSGGGELVVDAETVVTPQALEAAQAAGVTINSGSGGAWQVPQPDRGPDAARAMKSLSNLPEPEGGASDGRGVIITVVGKNRPGVLAEITAHLATAGCNIHKVSQEIVEGYFHLVLTVELDGSSSFNSLKSGIECLGGEDDFVARAMHERVFRFMHRV
ncbi:MAG: ACT domain-containing protein [Planctomycetota bacterium]|nr:ACT domain-containing protein [Planctomycetota bacterium]